MRILITGSEGFIGKNLRVALSRRADAEVYGFDVASSAGDLERWARSADFIFHLAGVNRPPDPSEFETGNVELTRRLVELLEGRPTPVVFSSSIQAELDNPYGRSKQRAEAVLRDYSERTGAPVTIFRFPNVFGKWSKPNYNSVVSTFCHNAAVGLPLQVTDRSRAVTFVYIDEVIRALLDCLDHPWNGYRIGGLRETFTLTLGELHDLVLDIARGRAAGLVPDLQRPFVRYLHATYLSYLPDTERARAADVKTDARGWLFELVKSPHAGQVFVSLTRPGIVRGNHYHDTKIEKFCVIQGQGIVRMRPVLEPASVMEYEVSDNPIRIVDIPPGWTHSIENIGTTDMLTLFWASEIFDATRPDTYPAAVKTRS